ncbi:protein kinase [Zymoseptoria brevis]|uniref:non-specific serine/threonine protein kinase n=1 Tax=Zymoseptoria brevis TaxID=1047168 RepID=A0A0F4G791_9PEZI|nr:protein kinase [Zymoseptoria brevis]
MSRFLKTLLPYLSRRVKDVPQPVRNDTLPSASTVASTNLGPSPDRHYNVRDQEKFHDNRYEAIKQLGEGRYSRVWLARDLRQNTYVALKILTNDCYGTEHDIFEIEILETITREQNLHETQDAHVLGLLDRFQLTGPNGRHECLALPVLGCTLGFQARRFVQRRIPVRVMKHITRQLLTGLAFLHETCRVIHTDLQPSNICFDLNVAMGQSLEQVTPRVDEDAPGTVRIIDFGVASWIDNHLTDNIQPEHLRAPEVILGAPWGPPIDIWSLGCLVIEFIKGHVAFPGQAKEGSYTSSDDHLAQYMEVLGPMPRELLERGTKSQEYFNEQGALHRIPTLKQTSLQDYVVAQQGPFQRPADMPAEEALLFLDFLQGALALDPQHRKTAKELLGHEWLSDVA